MAILMLVEMDTRLQIPRHFLVLVFLSGISIGAAIAQLGME